jgi:hypothetical protein
MRKLSFNSLAAQPTIALVGRILVWFDLIPLGSEDRRTFVLVWAIVTLALWVATVVLASALMKGPRWLVHPLGMLTLTGTIATGIGGFLRGSVALFIGLLGPTLAASFLSLHEARRGTGRCPLFCRGFAVGIWVGVVLSLLARGPVTDTPILQVMWWDATEWGGGLSWNGAAYQGVNYLLLTWFFALCVGWLAGLYEDRRKAHRSTKDNG